MGLKMFAYERVYHSSSEIGKGGREIELNEVLSPFAEVVKSGIGVNMKRS